MKIKNYKCKCGHDDFFFVENGNSMGIYCSYCGKWKKWADKDERNLSMKQDQKTGKWIEKGRSLGNPYSACYTCSECGNAWWNVKGDWKFCPKCGARMVCAVKEIK